MANASNGRLVYGVGVNDLGISGVQNKQCTRTLEEMKIYQEWTNMLTRCYSLKLHQKQHTYIGCSVCIRWHKLSNFYTDIKKVPGFQDWKANGYTGYVLDKDSLVKGNKEYAPDKVCFITKPDSGKEVQSRYVGGTNPNGRPSKSIRIVFTDGSVKDFASCTEASQYLGCDHAQPGHWLRGTCSIPKKYNIKSIQYI